MRHISFKHFLAAGLLAAVLILAATTTSAGQQQQHAGPPGSVPAKKDLFPLLGSIDWGSHPDKLIYWDEKLVLESWIKGNWKVVIGALMQYDLAWLNPDTAIADTYPDSDKGGGEFRRLRVSAYGVFWGFLQAKAQFDLTGDSKDRLDLWAGLKNIPNDGYVRMGYQKVPFSLEQLTSSEDITFMERSLPNALVPQRNLSLNFQWPFLNKRMTLGAAADNYSKEFGGAITNFSKADFTARLTGLPWYEDNSARLLHLGLNYSRGARNEEVSYSTRPESFIEQERFLNTGNFFVSELSVLGLEMAWQRKALNLQGEYINLLLEGASSNYSFQGFYLQASYFLTGEWLPYNTSTARYEKVLPKKDFHLNRGGGWGAWQVAGRLSYLDLDDKDIHGGREINLTGALNWYLNRYLRLSLNWVFASVMDQPTLPEGDGYFWALQTRIQFSF